MAARESVQFDFLSQGASELASDFRKTGDSATLAAKGARLLADSLDKQRRAAGASAQATLAQARADKILADAEDEAIAKTVGERIATEKAAAAKKADAEAAKRDAEQVKKAAEQHQRLADIGKRAGGLAGGLGLFGAGAAGLGLAGPLAAATAGLAAFGAVAVPELAKVEQALAKTGKARRTAFAALSGPEKQLAGDVEKFKDAFHGLESSLAPVIDSLVKFGGKLLTDAMPAIRQLATTGGTVIREFLAPLDTFVKTKTFASLATQLSSLAVQAGQVLGPSLVQLLKVMLQLFVQVGPSGIKMLKALLPTITQLVVALTPTIVLVSKLTAAFLTFLNQKHLLIPFLGLVAAAFLAISAGGGPIFATVAAIAALVAAGTYLVKHWSQVWAGVKSVAADAWKFISSGWGRILLPGIYLLVKAIMYARDHWSGAWNDIKHAVDVVWKYLKIAFDEMELAALSWAKTFVHAAAVAFGWVPGLGPKLREADRALGSFISSTEARLRSLTDHHYAITFGLNLPPGVSAGPSFQNRRKYASGTPGAAPGWAWVGERGPELVNMRGGETVIPNHSLGGYAAGTGEVSVHLSLPTLRAMSQVFGSAVAAIVQQVRQHATLTGGLSFRGAAGGGGVSRWAGTALAALALLGQPASDLGTVLSQMATESGGNPFIVNKWDSNWLAGTPSVGLMQVIGPTFASYAGPFRNTGPFEYGTSVNPLANIYAGLNYAIHRYGAGWTNVLGHGHGYDSGGYLPTGWSLAYNGTGSPEPVIPHGRLSGQTVIVNVHVGHGTNPVQAAREIAEVLNAGARSGVRLRRSILSANG